MKFIANENFLKASFLILKDLGYDIQHIGETNPSITDEEVIEIATSENRVIITFDRDYGELIFKNNFKVPGVIYLRVFDFQPDFPAEIIHNLVSNTAVSLENHFTVVDAKHFRQRRI